jgi:hypothetical protein
MRMAPDPSIHIPPVLSTHIPLELFDAVIPEPSVPIGMFDDDCD